MAAVLVFFILLFIFWNRKLTVLVEAKTKDLEAKNIVVESQKLALEKSSAIFFNGQPSFVRALHARN